MTRSADDETLRVPAGCPKHPVHRPCLRRTPGRDPTLERRSPEVKAEARFRSNLASRSPLGERSARAFRLAIPWHDPATCGAAAMPRNHPRHADSHERFHTLCDPSSRLLRILGPGLSLRLAATCPFPKFGTEGHWRPRRRPFPEERRAVQDRFCLLASPASTTLLHGSTLAESASPLAGTKRARCCERLGGV
jgi:hypothetical protein